MAASSIAGNILRNVLLIHADDQTPGPGNIGISGDFGNYSNPLAPLPIYYLLPYPYLLYGYLPNTLLEFGS